MSRHRASWWSKRVEELSRGGDAAAIAARHGVRTQTLMWWRSELGKRARSKPASAGRLLPVVVERSRHASDEGIDIVVELGSARVVVRGSVSAEHLAAIVSAARGC